MNITPNSASATDDTTNFSMLGTTNIFSFNKIDSSFSGLFPRKLAPATPLLGLYFNE